MIYTQDDVLAGLAAASAAGTSPRDFQKNITAAKAAGSFQSGWLATGTPGPGSAAPAYTAGSGYACSVATPGAMLYTNGSVQNWLAMVSGNAALRGTIYIYDRLWSCSGMGFAAGTYAVTTPGALPARITDGGVGCEIWIEQFVAAGAASGTAVVNYLDQGGAAGVGTIAAVVSAPLIGQIQRVPLATGDTGVSGIVSVVTSATWTSGSFGVTIMKKIAKIPVATIGVEQICDWAATCLPRLPSDMCLQVVWMPEVVTATLIQGSYAVIDK